MGKNKNSGKQARKVMPPNSNTKVREGAGASGTNVGHSNVRNPSETPRSSSNPTASGTSVGASAKSSPSSSKGSMRPTVSIPAAKSSLPPPPPDPVFVLRSGSTSSVTCVQYISPALRLNELSPSQSEALSAAYGSPDQDGSEASGGGNGPPLLKLPPPGFLLPTTHIAAGLQNGAISVWDLKTKAQVACWQAHTVDCAVLSIKSISPNTLVTMARRDCLKLWNFDLSLSNDSSSSNDNSADNAAHSTNRFVPEFTTQIPIGDYLGFASCDVFKQVNCIVAAMPGGPQDAVSVWSVKDRIKICQLRVNETTKVGSVMQLKWVEKRNRVSLLVAYESGDLCLWDWSNRDLHSIACIKGTPVSLEYDQSLGHGVLGTTEDGIFVFNISSSLDLTIVKEMTVTNEGLGCCISRPDSKIYATGGWDNRIRIFSWNKHKPLAVLDYHANSVSCLHYSPSRVVSYDGAGPISAGAEHVLAAGSLDASVSLWKIY